MWPFNRPKKLGQIRLTFHETNGMQQMEMKMRMGKDIEVRVTEMDMQEQMYLRALVGSIQHAAVSYLAFCYGSESQRDMVTAQMGSIEAQDEGKLN